MKTILCILFWLAALTVNAEVSYTTRKNPGDTIKTDIFTAPDTVKKFHNRSLSLIPPAIAIAYGASTFVVHPLRRIDFYLAGEIKKTNPGFNTQAESYFLFTPIAMVYGLNLIGVSGKNTFIDRTALLALSGGYVGVSEEIVKHLSHRLRPNQSDYYSFPSAHTGIAFMGAEFLAQEYSDKSPVYTVIGYTFAVTTGVFRMYNRDHWFSDVVAGAGFGVLSTKLAYITYPYIRNYLTHKGKNGHSLSLVPSFQNGAPGFAFAMQL